MLIVICHVEKFDIAIERVTHFELSDYFKTSLKQHNIEFLVARYGFVLFQYSYLPATYCRIFFIVSCIT